MTTPFPFTSGQVLTAAQMNAITTLPINDQTANYTLVVGDVGKRVIMNVSTASTVTVNNNVFAAGDTIFIANKASNASVITAGAGVSINTSGSLSLAQYGGGTLVALSASNFTFFPAGGIGYGTATGGTSNARTIGGENYTVLTFASDDNLVVTKSGLFDVLLVGGGGGGGGTDSSNKGGGGGGAGALVGFAATTTIYLAAATYAIDVGAGGAGTQALSNPGAASYIANIISACGGGGANGYDSGANVLVAGDGGSGAGGTQSNTNGESVDETFGNDGGTGNNGAANGGGGGYASAGGNGAGTTGGAGGNGIDVSSWGTSGSTDNIAAGGGGGASGTGGAAGTGGVAGKTSGAGNNATTAGSGGGGTYGASAVTGGNGAAGKVFVRFKV